MINDTELNYITNKIYSQFNGVFIADINNIFKYYAGVEYGDSIRVNPTAVFEPIGSKYPIVVSNGLTNYESGSVSGRVILDQDLYNSTIDRFSELTYRNELVNFLTNKRAKVLKDWNGNIYLMIVMGNPVIKFDNNLGMGLADVGFEWTEIGDVNNKNDLYRTGMINITEVGL